MPAGGHHCPDPGSDNRGTEKFAERRRTAVESLRGEPARLLRTMYSDGGHGAPMRCARAGAGVGALIAAEDADAGAGCCSGPVWRQGDVLLWNAKAGGVVPVCPQRAFIGHYSGRAQRLPHGCVTLGGIELVLHCGRQTLAGRAAGALRTAYPRRYILLRGHPAG